MHPLLLGATLTYGHYISLFEASRAKWKLGYFSMSSRWAQKTVDSCQVSRKKVDSYVRRTKCFHFQ